jgi:succinate-acetate transporter protein
MSHSGDAPSSSGGPARPPEATADPSRDSLQAARVFLRPIADPFALGFLGLAGATLTVSGLELGWIPADQRLQVALITMTFAPVLQVIGCVFGFLGRDPVAATGMGALALTWEVIGLTLLVSSPGSHSEALGTLLFLSAAAMLLSATTAGMSKIVPATVLGVAGLRFLVTALYEVMGSSSVETAAGVIGCVLAALSLYAAFALELEGVKHRPLLPIGRHGPGRHALDPRLSAQVEQVAKEPGVRARL